MGQAIAFNPCFSCNRKEMCHLCELEMRRSGDVSTQKWISVEERLPRPTQMVLVCKTFCGKPYVDIGYVNDAETCRCASDEYIIKPWLHQLTHWMPLPDAPKGDEGE